MLYFYTWFRLSLKCWWFSSSKDPVPLTEPGSRPENEESGGTNPDKSEALVCQELTDIPAVFTLAAIPSHLIRSALVVRPRAGGVYSPERAWLHASYYSLSSGSVWANAAGSLSITIPCEALLCCWLLPVYQIRNCTFQESTDRERQGGRI